MPLIHDSFEQAVYEELGKLNITAKTIATALERTQPEKPTTQPEKTVDAQDGAAHE